MEDGVLTPAETLEVAKGQKGVLWCILANFGLFVLLHFVDVAQAGDPSKLGSHASAVQGAEFLFSLACVLLLSVVEMYFVYKLASGLGSSMAWLWCAGMLLPCVNILILLRLSANATKAIRAQGVKVGLMGANLAELRRLAQEA